jgi:RNA polymerase sigma-70 factor (ECF subfamily)
VQTAFLRLYRAINQFQFTAKFSTYFFRIMMNVCFDLIQKRRGKKEQVFEAMEISHAPRIDLRLQLEEAINTLPERMRACFMLFAVEEMKQDEIAEILNLSVGTVKAQVFHAKARLRALLADAPMEATI